MNRVKFFHVYQGYQFLDGGENQVDFGKPPNIYKQNFSATHVGYALNEIQTKADSLLEV